MSSVPEVFTHWEAFTAWLLDRTEKFPKRLRFTLTNRLDNLTLDVFEALIEARYTRDRARILEDLNLKLETLRLLLRIAKDRRVLDVNSFEHACRTIDTAGRMVGGWLKYSKEKA